MGIPGKGSHLTHAVQETPVGNGVISSLLQAVVHHLERSQQLIVDKVSPRVILQHLLYIHAVQQQMPLDLQVQNVALSLFLCKERPWLNSGYQNTEIQCQATYWC